MQIKEYLFKYQPTIYQTFVNALSNEKLSHAYLISGNPGMPLKEVALYLNRTILLLVRYIFLSIMDKLK